MSFSQEDSKKIANAYCDYQIEHMDYDQLSHLAKDLLMQTYSHLDYEEITAEIQDLYDDDVLQTVVKNAQISRSPVKDFYEEVLDFYRNPLNHTFVQN